ncbi:MAG TPA: NCS2 family permease [Phycisphaerae bacterium]|nr:NCS2 family permease [Phycisphaerae bacterium]
MPSAISSCFKLAQQNTSLRTEIVAGVTTFVTMAYIIVINPAILAFAGIPTGPSTVATILTAVFGCLLMGLYARLPIAVAPYMGENAFIAFGLVALGVTWEQRLGSVFLAGAAFLVLTFVGARAWLANSISSSMKHSFAVGIGLFLLFIGLYETGIVTSGVTGMPVAAVEVKNGVIVAPAVPVKIGDLRDAKVLLAIGGFVLMAILTFWRVRGAILLGIIITGVVGVAMGLAKPPEHIVAMPFVGDYSLGRIAFHLDLKGLLHLTFLPILLTLFLMSFLDTLGTLVGVGAAGGFLDEKNDFPHIERPMTVDALSCMFAGLVGTSTSGAFIESATGIREGGRTGLTAIVVAVLFAAALFFIPVAQALQQLQFAYGPALIMVGVLMVSSARHFRYDDMTEVVPAVATIAMMLFTYNIANGLTAGLVLYPVLKIAAGRWSDLRAGSVVLGLLCAGYYVFGLPH